VHLFDRCSRQVKSRYGNVEAVAEMLRAMVRLMVDRPDEAVVETVEDGLDLIN
jgi:hypothetical protein